MDGPGLWSDEDKSMVQEQPKRDPFRGESRDRAHGNNLQGTVQKENAGPLFENH